MNGCHLQNAAHKDVDAFLLMEKEKSETKHCVSHVSFNWALSNLHIQSKQSLLKPNGLIWCNKLPMRKEGFWLCIQMYSLYPSVAHKLSSGWEDSHTSALTNRHICRLIGYLWVGYVLIGYLWVGYVLIGYLCWLCVDWLSLLVMCWLVISVGYVFIGYLCVG